MAASKPPPGFSCDALHTQNCCLCDDTPCHFPTDVQNCFLQKQQLQAARQPHRIGEHEHVPRIAPEPDAPHSIKVSRELLRQMMHRKPPKV